MENANLPKSNPVEFSGNAEDDDNGKSKKAKKSKFAKWLSYLVPSEVASQPESKDDEEPSRTERFLESFKSLFGIFSNVEKQEVEELTKPSQQPIYNESLIFAIDEVEETAPSETEADEVLDEAHENFDVEVNIEHPSDASEAPIEEPAETGLSDVSLATRDSVLPIERLSSQYSDDNEAARAQSISETPRYVNEKQREIIIEKRSGGGAALLGFVAAETLSRSRDKKIRNDAVKLRDKVDKLEQKQSSTELDLHHAREHNRKQLDELKAKRETREEFDEVGKEHHPKQSPPEIQTKVFYTKEKPNWASAGDIQPNKDPKQSIIEHEIDTKFASDSKIKPEYHRSFEALAKKDPIEKPSILTQDNVVSAEQAHEKYINPEAYFDKRHEVKDVSVTSNKRFVSSQSGGQVQTVSNIHSSDNDKLQVLQAKQAEAHQTQVMYKQAAKQGVWVGALIVLAALIAMLLMSLL